MGEVPNHTTGSEKSYSSVNHSIFSACSAKIAFCDYYFTNLKMFVVFSCINNLEFGILADF